MDENVVYYNQDTETAFLALIREARAALQDICYSYRGNNENVAVFAKCANIFQSFISSLLGQTDEVVRRNILRSVMEPISDIPSLLRVDEVKTELESKLSDFVAESEKVGVKDDENKLALSNMKIEKMEWILEEAAAHANLRDSDLYMELRDLALRYCGMVTLNAKFLEIQEFVQNLPGIIPVKEKRYRLLVNEEQRKDGIIQDLLRQRAALLKKQEEQQQSIDSLNSQLKESRAKQNGAFAKTLELQNNMRRIGDIIAKAKK
jgi:hypothetical protein